MAKHVIHVWLALIPVATVVGCREPSNPAADGRLRVAVSIVPQVWLVKQIGGDRVEVVPVVRPGESPATYQPSDAQVTQVMTSAVYFRIGTPFERGPWFKTIESSHRLKIVDTRGNIVLRDMACHVHPESDEGHHHEHDHGGHAEHGPHPAANGHDGKDPHIWLSPRLLKSQARIVARTLGELDPEHAREYNRNLDSLERRLDGLNQTLRQKLKPVRGKAFVVFHPAWGYFADEYGLRQVAVEVQGKDPSDHQLTHLQKRARKEGVSVVFVQPQISSTAAQAVATAIGARVQPLDPLAEDVPAGLIRAAEALVESYE